MTDNELSAGVPVTTEIRKLQVIHAYATERMSRKLTERFILLDAAEKGLPVPQPPIAKYWCRQSPEGSPAPFIIGWTAPCAVDVPGAAEAVGAEALRLSPGDAIERYVSGAVTEDENTAFPSRTVAQGREAPEPGFAFVHDSHVIRFESEAGE